MRPGVARPGKGVRGAERSVVETTVNRNIVYLFGKEVVSGGTLCPCSEKPNKMKVERFCQKSRSLVTSVRALGHSGNVCGCAGK